MTTQNTVFTADGSAVTLIRKRNAGRADTLRLHADKELYYLTSPLLEEKEWLYHGFSTRLGGVSMGETATMNLSFPREETPDHVRENYRRLAAAIGFDENSVTMTHQTHTNHVRVVDAADAGAGFAFDRPWRDVDALVTAAEGVTLICFSADCVPVLFADEKKRVVACAHSGWRGTLSDIAGETVRTMQQRFGCNPADITAAVGPSICADCYEVGEEVAEQFDQFYEDAFEKGILRHGRNDRYLLGLWEAVRVNLVRAGLDETHISLPDLCTKCNGSLFFSHRLQGGRQGNQGAVIGIKNTGII